MRHGVVIVGSSVGGVRAARALRAEGYRGRVTLVGEEPDLPCDRPPLSKQVLTGATEFPNLHEDHVAVLDAQPVKPAAVRPAP